MCDVLTNRDTGDATLGNSGNGRQLRGSMSVLLPLKESCLVVTDLLQYEQFIC